MALPSPQDRQDALYDVLRSLKIDWTTHTHKAVFTVDEAKTLYDLQPGCHTKNLFLEDRKGGLWLVVLQDHLKVDLNRLSRQLGAPRFSFAAPQRLLETLAVEPGSVTPFAVMNDPDQKVQLVLDAVMLGREPLNFHPLRNDRTTAISAEDLLRFVRACRHEPIITTIPDRP